MSNYKLTYFDIRGKAEVIRLLFNYGQVKFEDHRIKREEWPAFKQTTPLGQLPVLEIDGEVFPQSTAIARYVAGQVGLYGKNAKESLEIDVVIDTITDLSQVNQESRMAKEEPKKSETLKKLAEKKETVFKKLESTAQRTGGFVALNRLTWADIAFINLYENMNNGSEDLLKSYPNLQKVKANVLSQPSIKEYIKNRPADSRPPHLANLADQKQYDLKQDL